MAETKPLDGLAYYSILVYVGTDSALACELLGNWGIGRVETVHRCSTSTLNLSEHKQVLDLVLDLGTPCTEEHVLAGSFRFLSHRSIPHLLTHPWGLLVPPLPRAHNRCVGHDKDHGHHKHTLAAAAPPT